MKRKGEYCDCSQAEYLDDKFHCRIANDGKCQFEYSTPCQGICYLYTQYMNDQKNSNKKRYLICN